MRKWLLALFLLHPVWAEGGKLLDEVVANPGYWSQMCSLYPMPGLRELPLFGFQRYWAEARISPANFQRLRADRTEVLAEISRRLESSAAMGRAPDAWETYLLVLWDLNGVEALPALLKWEETLDATALYRTNPSLLETGLGRWPRDEAKAAELFSISNGCWRHARVLSIITVLLAQEEAPGLQRLGKEARYDQAHRDLIVQLAQDFLRLVPAREHRGAAAMSEEPAFR